MGRNSTKDVKVLITIVVPLPWTSRLVASRQLDGEQVRKLIEGYEAGATVYELGDQFGSADRR